MPHRASKMDSRRIDADDVIHLRDALGQIGEVVVRRQRFDMVRSIAGLQRVQFGVAGIEAATGNSWP